LGAREEKSDRTKRGEEEGGKISAASCEWLRPWWNGRGRRAAKRGS